MANTTSDPLAAFATEMWPGPLDGHVGWYSSVTIAACFLQLVMFVSMCKETKWRRGLAVGGFIPVALVFFIIGECANIHSRYSDPNSVGTYTLGRFHFYAAQLTLLWGQWHLLFCLWNAFRGKTWSMIGGFLHVLPIYLAQLLFLGYITSHAPQYSELHIRTLCVFYLYFQAFMGCATAYGCIALSYASFRSTKAQPTFKIRCLPFTIKAIHFQLFAMCFSLAFLLTSSIMRAREMASAGDRANFLVGSDSGDMEHCCLWVAFNLWLLACCIESPVRFVLVTAPEHAAAPNADVETGLQLRQYSDRLPVDDAKQH